MRIVVATVCILIVAGCITKPQPEKPSNPIYSSPLPSRPPQASALAGTQSRAEQELHEALAKEQARGAVFSNSTHTDVATARKTQTNNACSSYKGQTITPKTFDSAIAPFLKLTPKGEFETTAQYEARRTASLTGTPDTLVISKEPEDRKYFEYDADAGVLRIKQFAFDNRNMDVWRAFYSAGLYGKLDASTISNKDVVIFQSDRPTGTYLASNAFGAKAEVVTIQRVTKGIFEGPQKGASTSLFPASEKRHYAVGELRVPVEEAKRLKEELKIAFVVAPKQPYIVKGRHKMGEVTITNPRDITEDFTILVADIRCGLVMDRSGRVLGSYPTY